MHWHGCKALSKVCIKLHLSCHLASCHSPTYDHIVITNFVVKCTSHALTNPQSFYISILCHTICKVSTVVEDSTSDISSQSVSPFSEEADVVLNAEATSRLCAYEYWWANQSEKGTRWVNCFRLELCFDVQHVSINRKRYYFELLDRVIYPDPRCSQTVETM